jgi:uncharacterized protein YgiM (DUF1202 family)
MTESAPFTHVVEKDTPYYETGPQQGRPKDGTLAKGTKVRLTGKNIGGYVQIDAENGVQGYVAQSDLKETNHRFAIHEDPSKPKDTKG